VVTLSEQSQAIDEIVSSVQDLADQSNLLAVNASIEAARAGDQGRGFAVVSQEIKTLADQSKNATDQIRTILDDTRKWVSTVVMATEQGTKAVESGVEQSVLAGESIKSLVDRVASSAQEATVIAASTDEQLAGIEQASSAMVQIEKAMHQNLEGTSQVEVAAKKLESLGNTLNELVKYYKV
jgi:methyl-accepting chemotaxis protein